MSECPYGQLNETTVNNIMSSLNIEHLQDISAGAVYAVQSFFQDQGITFPVLNQAVDMFKLFKNGNGNGILWVFYEGCTRGYVGMDSVGLQHFTNTILGIPL